jgi:hypothetical protein
MSIKKQSLVVISLTISLLTLLGPTPKTVLARESNNVVGVNLACLWNPGMVPEIVDLVKPGGWLVIMAVPGDGQALQELLDELDARATNGVNLIIRLDKQKQSFTQADAAAWVAMLGNLETDQKIFVMPWNEPNQYDQRQSKWIEAEDVTSRTELIEKVKKYSDAFNRYLNESGLRDSGRVFLLSPAFNQSYEGFPGDYEDFINDLGGKAFYDQFDGAAMNLYDFRDKESDDPLGQNDEHLNAGQYRSVLGTNLANKPAFALESGTAVFEGSLGVRYTDKLISSTIGAVGPIWKSDPNFNMFAVFSYDPEWEENWNIFQAPLTQNVYADIARGGGGIIPGGNPPPGFNQWVQQKIDNEEIVACPDGIGYAAKIDFCSYVCGRGGIGERRIVQATETDEALADPILLQHSGLNYTSLTPLNPIGESLTRGGLLQNFTDLEIPFLPILAEYLAGPYMYKNPSAIKEAQALTTTGQTGFQPWTHGLLATLLPGQIQDNLRYQYWKNCYDGYFIPLECLVLDEDNHSFPIQNIPEPPNKEEIFASENTDWRSRYLDLWNQIPLIDDPLVRTENAVETDCCPENSTSQTSNAVTEIPYLYGINTAAQILHDQWMPKITASTTSEDDSTLSCYQDFQENNPVCDPNQPPEDKCLITTETTPGLAVEIKGAEENEPWTAFYGPTENLSCTWEFDPQLNAYKCQDSPDFNNNPLRPRATFPYLSSIYENLTGPQGFFRFLLDSEIASNWEENPDEIGKWDAYVASRLNYCFEPAPGDPSLVNFFPNTMASQGEIKQYDDFADPPSPGVCNGTTENLSVYIPYLGGVASAAEWVASRPSVPAALLKEE